MMSVNVREGVAESSTRLARLRRQASFQHRRKPDGVSS
jgi:hypothetical protein